MASHGAPPTISIQPASGRTSPAGIVPLGAPADPVALAAAGAVVAAKAGDRKRPGTEGCCRDRTPPTTRDWLRPSLVNPDPNAIIVLGDSPAKVTVEEPVAPGAVKSQSRDPEYAWNLKVFAGDSAKSALSVTDWANIRASLLRRNWRMVKEGADVSQLQIFGYKYLANERPAYGLIAPKTSSGQVHFQALIKDIAIELKIAIRAWLPGERSQDFTTIKFPLDYAELSPEECMTSVEAFRPGLKGHWTVFASEDRPVRTGPGRNIVLLVNPEFVRELNKTPMRGLDSLAGELRIWRGQSADDPELPNYALAAKSSSGMPSSTAKSGGAGRTSASGSTAKSGGPAKGGPVKGGAGTSASAAKTGPNAHGRGRGSGKGSSTVPKPHWCAEAPVAGPSKAAPAASASSSASRWNSVPKRKRSAGSTPEQGRKRSRKWDDAPAKPGGSQDSRLQPKIQLPPSQRLSSLSRKPQRSGQGRVQLRRGCRSCSDRIRRRVAPQARQPLRCGALRGPEEKHFKSCSGISVSGAKSLTCPFSCSGICVSGAKSLTCPLSSGPSCFSTVKYSAVPPGSGRSFLLIWGGFGPYYKNYVLCRVLFSLAALFFPDPDRSVVLGRWSEEIYRNKLQKGEGRPKVLSKIPFLTTFDSRTSRPPVAAPPPRHLPGGGAPYSPKRRLTQF